ncbi:hypothetical protein F1880_007444 [Penicillium rolfsii]|nr:hypothetical protein F1880_007444 [Penicillium rolfsii]
MVANSQQESFDLGVDPAILPTAYTLDRPSSLAELRDFLDELKDGLLSDEPPRSQFLLVRDIPSEIFLALLHHAEVPKGVRATVLHYEHVILYKIMVHVYHEKICLQFNTWLTGALGQMGLSFFNDDFWLGGAGRSTGRVCSKEPDASFYPGRQLDAGAPVPWPSLVLEVGLSESVPQLRTDARWWYSNSSHQTQLVVLIYANPSTHDASIEIWTPVPNRRAGPTTRS